jgi:hypothetical protein
MGGGFLELLGRQGRVVANGFQHTACLINDHHASQFRKTFPQIWSAPDHGVSPSNPAFENALKTLQLTAPATYAIAGKKPVSSTRARRMSAGRPERPLLWALELIGLKRVAYLPARHAGKCRRFLLECLPLLPDWVQPCLGPLFLLLSLLTLFFLLCGVFRRFDGESRRQALTVLVRSTNQTTNPATQGRSGCCESFIGERLVSPLSSVGIRQSALRNVGTLRPCRTGTGADICLVYKTEDTGI